LTETVLFEIPQYQTGKNDFSIACKGDDDDRVSFRPVKGGGGIVSEIDKGFLAVPFNEEIHVDTTSFLRLFRAMI